MFFLFLGLNAIAQQKLSVKRFESGKYGYINDQGSKTIEPKFDKAFAFQGEFAKVKVSGKWALIDSKGEYIIKPIYDYIGFSNDPYFIKNKSNLSLTNNAIPVGSLFQNPHQNAIALMKNKFWALHNINGKTGNFEWDSVRSGEGGHFAVYKQGFGWNWINLKSKTAQENYFDNLQTLGNGLISVKSKGDTAFTILNEEGNPISEKKFKRMGSLNQNLMKFYENGKWGVLDISGEVKYEALYEDVKYNKWNNTLQLYPYSDWIKSDENFENKSDLGFQIEHRISNEYYLVQKNDIKYLWNESRNDLQRLNVKDSLIYENNHFFIQKNNGSRYILNDKFKRAFDYPITDIVIIPNSDCVLLREKGRRFWVLLDEDWKLLMNAIDSFEITPIGGYIKLKRGRNIGLYDLENRKWKKDWTHDKIQIFEKKIFCKDANIIEVEDLETGTIDTLKGTDFTFINDSLFGVKNLRYWSLWSLNLEKIKDTNFREILSAEKDHSRVKIDDYWTIFDLQNLTKDLRDSYDSIGPLLNGYRIVRKGKMYGIINEEGYFTYPLQEYYDEISGFYNEWSDARLRGLAGKVDRNGILTISSQYEEISSPAFSYYPFKFRSMWGVLDKREKIRVQPLYDSLSFLDSSHVLIWKNEKCGIVDLFDKNLVSVEYDNIQLINDAFFLCYRNGKKGLLRKDGSQIRPSVFEEIEILGSDLILLKKDDNYRLIDESGRFISNVNYKSFFKSRSTPNYYYKESKKWEFISLD